MRLACLVRVCLVVAQRQLIAALRQLLGILQLTQDELEGGELVVQQGQPLSIGVHRFMQLHLLQCIFRTQIPLHSQLDCMHTADAIIGWQYRHTHKARSWADSE